MGPLLGGVGVGLVWGWWLVTAAASPAVRPASGLILLGSASVLLAAGIFWIAGVSAAIGLAAATGISLLFCVAVRAELKRASSAEG